MASIDWSAFTWEAFATLATGVGAVIAAVVVGLRQTGIADRQTDILGRQAEVQSRLEELEELKLRQALFTDRFAVYEDTRAFLNFIVMHAAIPTMRAEPGHEVPDEERQLVARFLASLDRSRFLFRPEVYERLSKLWRDAVQVSYRQKEINRTEGKARSRAVDAEHELILQITALHQDLSTAFGDELTLSRHGAVHGDRPRADPEPV